MINKKSVMTFSLALLIIVQFLTGSIQVFASETINANGFNTVAVSYYVKETKAPNKYEITGTGISDDITLIANTTSQITVENKLLKVTLKVLKKDLFSKAPINGTTFDLFDENNNKVGSYTTANDGTFTVNDLVIGKYTLVETKASPGYKLSKEPIEVDLSNYQVEPIEKTIFNEPTVYPVTGNLKPVLTLVFLTTILVYAVAISRKRKTY